MVLRKNFSVRENFSFFHTVHHTVYSVWHLVSKFSEREFLVFPHCVIQLFLFFHSCALLLCENNGIWSYLFLTKNSVKSTSSLKIISNTVWKSTLKRYTDSGVISYIYSHSFLAKISWKQRFCYIKKSLKRWFDEIFFRSE